MKQYLVTYWEGEPDNEQFEVWDTPLDDILKEFKKYEEDGLKTLVSVHELKVVW